VPECVVHLLEAVKVDQEHARGVALVPQRGRGHIVEPGSIRKTRQGVVLRRVLVTSALPNSSVGRQHRCQEQRHQDHRIGSGRDHDRREHQHRSAGDRHEQRVLPEVLVDRDALVHRDRDADNAIVDQEEHAGAGHDGRHVAAPERMLGADSGGR
jgi:hypothetical protein